ncbi:MAG: hypothetical protein ACFFC7_28490 [Candidatus Hermodarchaeota archaeon]
MTKKKALRLYYIVFVILLMLCSNSLASMGAEEIPWSQIYGTQDFDEGRRIITTDDGGLALVGTIERKFQNDRADFWLVKIDETGQILWNRTYGNDEADEHFDYKDRLNDAILTKDGGFALVGITQKIIPDESADSNSWLVKTDSSGLVQWNYTYGYESMWYGGSEWTNGITQHADGGFILTGWKDEKGLWLVKVDSNGLEEWNQTYDKDYSWGVGVVQVADGGVVVGGGSRATWNETSNFLLMKLDNNGSVQWKHIYDNNGDQRLTAFIPTRDNGFALAGINASWYGIPPQDIWLIKTDANGMVEWNQTYGYYDYQNCKALIQTSDHGFALAGMCITGRLDSGHHDWDGLLIKTDANGVVQFYQTYDCGAQEEFSDLIQMNDGGFSLLGRAPDPSGSYDFWLVRTDASGSPPQCSLNSSNSLNTSGLMISSVLATFVTLYYFCKRRK